VSSINWQERLEIYEKGRIKEYWSIEVAKKLVHTHILEGDRYKFFSKGPGESVSPQEFPELVVPTVL
jgi:hypothetical protein